MNSGLRAEAARTAKRGDCLITSHVVPGADPRPAVLALSGARGFGAGAYERMATTLNSAGMDVFFVHFLSAADIEAIDRAGSAKSRKLYYARRWDDWTRCVRASAATTRSPPRHEGKIGILGVSLGAELAAASASDSEEFAALVVVDGGPLDGNLENIRSLPPLLAIWGADDRVFAPAMGRRLRDFGRSIGGEAELRIYEHEPHAFFLEDGNEKAVDALARIRDFFVERLTKPERP